MKFDYVLIRQKSNGKFQVFPKRVKPNARYNDQVAWVSAFDFTVDFASVANCPFTHPKWVNGKANFQKNKENKSGPIKASIPNNKKCTYTVRVGTKTADPEVVIKK